VADLSPSDAAPHPVTSKLAHGDLVRLGGLEFRFELME